MHTIAISPEAQAFAIRQRGGKLRMFETIELARTAHVVVDLHEMSGNESYYFAPPADPLNPHITEAQRGWLREFGGRPDPTKMPEGGRYEQLRSNRRALAALLSRIESGASLLSNSRR